MLVKKAKKQGGREGLEVFQSGVERDGSKEKKRIIGSQAVVYIGKKKSVLRDRSESSVAWCSELGGVEKEAKQKEKGNRG